MDSLHIKTILESHKSVPGYDDIVECKQTLLAIVDGTRPVEAELRELESFRKTLMTLVREALAQMTACQDLEQALARLQVLCRRPSRTARRSARDYSAAA